MCILCVSSLDQWVICVSSLRIFFVCPLCVLFGTVCDLYVLFAAFTSTTTQVSDTGRIQEEAELYTAEGRVEVIHQLETTLACLHRGWCKITVLLLLLLFFWFFYQIIQALGVGSAVSPTFFLAISSLRCRHQNINLVTNLHGIGIVRFCPNPG